MQRRSLTSLSLQIGHSVINLQNHAPIFVAVSWCEKMLIGMVCAEEEEAASC